MTIHWVQAIVFFLLGTFFGGMVLGSIKGLFGGSKAA